ncbi:MAG: hypothetical protein E7662_07415 [Ruminococcaceae bacterium]|nr:hypothetical protein [Oscillospiraceae bacterium]
MRYSDFTAEHERAFIEFTRGGAAAVLIYSPNVLANGKVSRLDKDNRAVRTFAIGGIIYVPVVFFDHFPDVKWDGEKLIRGSASYAAGDISTGGIPAVQVLAAANALGFSAKAYCEGRFIAVGSADDIAVLDEDPALVHAGSYAILGEYDAATFTAEEFRKAKDNWRKKLVGTPEGNDMSNPAVAGKIAYIEKRCEEVLADMHRGTNPPEDDPEILFGNEPATESAHATRLYRYVTEMTRAYATPGSKYYRDASLLDNILYALGWLYRHIYGEAEIREEGWRSTRIFNWWDWYVGVPEYLTDIIFMIEDHLTKEEIKKYLACTEYVFEDQKKYRTPMSRICICTKVGLALEDPAYMLQEYKDYDVLLEREKTSGSLLEDYCCFTHGMPYNMAYGILHLDRVLLVASILAGTALEYASPQMYNQFMMAKYMFEAAMYRAQGFVMFAGRSNFRAEVDGGVAVMVNLLPMIGVFGADEDLYIKSMIKRNCQRPDVAEMMRSRCSLYDLALFEDLMRDESVPADREYTYAHAWYTGDRAAQHRNDYAVAIAMSTRREPSYESINSANKTGWYTGDGALYLYTKYDGNQYDGVNFINNLNIAYRYPGTTEDSRPRVHRSIMGSESWRMPTDFAGSLQFEDQYIAAAQDFVSFDFAGPDKNIPDTGYGGSIAVHRNDLRAKKAWFCFDNETVVLGAGITSTMDSPVHTTVEHRRIVHDGEAGYSRLYRCSGKTETLPDAAHESTVINADWLCMEGHAGFVFLENTELYLSRYNCDTCADQPYFEARIEHGSNPTNASYAYAILPYAGAEQLNAYKADPDVQILSNTAALQAVREKTLGITGYAFHESGICGDIGTDTPCIIMEKVCDGIRSMVLTDPTHLTEKITVTVEGQYKCAEADPMAEVVCGDGKATITYDTTLSNGRPFAVRLASI